MYARRQWHRPDDVQPLERLCLFTFIPFTPEHVVPASVAGVAGVTVAMDVAMAGDGKYLVIRQVFDDATNTNTVEVVRYTTNGEQLKSPITLASYGTGNLALDDNIVRVAAAMDVNGNAVVAYQVTEIGATPAQPSGVYVVTIFKSGQVGTPRRISDDSGSSPAVGMDVTGGFFLDGRTRHRRPPRWRDGRARVHAIQR